MPEVANDRMKMFKAIFRSSLQSIFILMQKKSRQMSVMTNRMFYEAKTPIHSARCDDYDDFRSFAWETNAKDRNEMER